MTSLNGIESLAIIAGSGDYPIVMAKGARQAGVKTLIALAIRGAAGKGRLRPLVDEWIPVGLGELATVRDWCVAHPAVAIAFAGGFSPTSLFTTRFDGLSRKLLSEMSAKNAHTLFGKVCDVLVAAGVRILPATSFMESVLPKPGVLTLRSPDVRETGDIELGYRIAMQSAALEIGQTVVVKDGAIGAVEALEGTNQAIRRGAELCGSGCVVVKVAKAGHDMRFDVPTFGMTTLKFLKKHRISAFAFQAYRTIFLEQDKVLHAANRWGIALVCIDSGLPPAPTA